MHISDWSSDVFSSDLICGGEDEESADAGERDAKLPGKIRTLSRKLAALLPGIDATPVHGWAGSFGDSPVGTPTIGRIPRMPNCYAAMGYGGNGITFSMMGAQVLRGVLWGYGDPDAGQTGTAAGRGRGGQVGLILVVAVLIKNKKKANVKE